MPISLVGHSVLFYFPEVHPDAVLSVDFQSTLRVPMMAQPMACRRVWVDCLCGGWRI